MNHPAKWFAILATAFVFLAVLSRVWRSTASLDLQLHDTYFVFSPFLAHLVIAVMLTLFATFYYIAPMNPRAAGVHFWATVLGLTVFWISFYLWGYLAARAPISSNAAAWELRNAVVFVVSTMIVLASPIFFAVNFVLTILRRYCLARSTSSHG